METSATFSGLACEKAYSFTVKARNGDGVESGESLPINRTSGACDTGGIRLIFLSPAPSTDQQQKNLDPNSPSDKKTDDSTIPKDVVPVLVPLEKVEVRADIGKETPITIGETDHILVVSNATPQTVTIILHSEPIQATLEVNVPRDFDTDGDGKPDTRALYTGLLNGKPNIVFTPIVTTFVPISTTTTISASTTPITSSTTSLNSTPSTKNQSPLFTKTLKRGDVGDDVVQLQTRLKKEGCFPSIVEIVPIFGAITENALKTCQRRYNIDQTGILDSTTRKILNGDQPVSPATISDRYYFTKILRRGSVGSEVFELQTLLKYLGLFPKDQTATGYFGVTTQGSLTVFQRIHNITNEQTANGPYTGPKTRLELNK